MPSYSIGEAVWSQGFLSSTCCICKLNSNLELQNCGFACLDKGYHHNICQKHTVNVINGSQHTPLPNWMSKPHNDMCTMSQNTSQLFFHHPHPHPHPNPNPQSTIHLPATTLPATWPLSRDQHHFQPPNPPRLHQHTNCSLDSSTPTSFQCLLACLHKPCSPAYHKNDLILFSVLLAVIEVHSESKLRRILRRSAQIACAYLPTISAY